MQVTTSRSEFKITYFEPVSIHVLSEYLTSFSAVKSTLELVCKISGFAASVSGCGIGKVDVKTGEKLGADVDGTLLQWFLF